MSISLKSSHSLKNLLTVLIENIKKDNDVFRSIYIVTQTQGMRNWLKQEIVVNLGIAANIRFVGMDEIIHKTYQLCGGMYSDTLDTHDLNWSIFEILDSDGFKNQFRNIAEYYSDITTHHAESKRMALAEKIADLFDQYQAYRNKMIASWNEGKLLHNEDYDEKWQMYLWNELKRTAQNYFRDKNFVGEFIKDKTTNFDILKAQLPNIYFFGLSLMTDYHVQLVYHLSKQINIHFYIQNPAPYDYWYEDKSEKLIAIYKSKGYGAGEDQAGSNPLLVNWGKLVQDTFFLLFQDDENLNAYDVVGELPEHKTTLLQSIQYSIFHNQKNTFHFSEEQIYDNSITINACYSPIREVETLYNHLVRLVDNSDGQLKARDIVVMVTDINLYASYIKAVFDNAPYKFFYTIADESFMEEDTAINALAAILEINENQFTAEKVLSLLDYSSIRQHFQITDVTMIRKVVDEANIRFGFKGERNNDSDYVSWTYGLKRIMYGVCMSGSHEYGEGENSFYPIDSVEGYHIQNIVKFVHFVEELIQIIKERNSARNIDGWVRYIEDEVKIFIGEPESEDNDSFRMLSDRLKKYRTLANVFNKNVSYKVFSDHLLNYISTERKSYAFSGGGITFCSLVPMRSIPFKVVALLGLNSDKFPRRDNRVSFDLMSKYRKRGDRNLKDNDKHLFLETLLSAGQYLYFSYIGQNISNNSPLPPSILIDELVEFIAENTEKEKQEDVRKNFIIRQPLHSYSKKYNQEDDRLFSYLIRSKSKTPENIKIPERQYPKINVVDFNEMMAFFKNPIKYFYNKTLKIYYNDDDIGISENEVFTLDKLEEWQIKNETLSLKKDEIDSYRIQGIKQGRFPLKNMGKVTIEAIFDSTKHLRKLYQAYTNDIAEKVLAFDTKIENKQIQEEYQLQGELRNIFGKYLVCYSFSNNDMKYKMQAYLSALILQVLQKDEKVIYISNKNNHATQVLLPISTQEYASERLVNFIELFLKAQTQMIPFDFSFKMKAVSAEELNDSIQNNIFRDAYITKEFENGTFEKDDIFNQFAGVRELLGSWEECFIKITQ
ncbi:MAG: exodeoxyribonuclease V subunit gamma [Chitinophagales bacterium]|nr:exodeoxyribonuclease V subunit gamma [Chitinophagales bacterium]